TEGQNDVLLLRAELGGTAVLAAVSRIDDDYGLEGIGGASLRRLGRLRRRRLQVDSTAEPQGAGAHGSPRLLRRRRLVDRHQVDHNAGEPAVLRLLQGLLLYHHRAGDIDDNARLARARHAVAEAFDEAAGAVARRIGQRDFDLG